MVDLSVVIVDYNAGDFLINCLRTLYDCKKEANLKVYLVDNDSKDESADKAKKIFPQIELIKNDENLGYGKANNIALKKIDTEFVLLLNPDTKMVPGTLEYMIKYMQENPDVGVATCKVEKEDGSIDWASHRGFPTPITAFFYYVLKNDKYYHLKDRDFNRVHEVDAVAGAFFITRKSVLDKVGLFDEDYFLYAEDIDLCYRIKQAGFKVMYVPEVKILHYKGVSSGIKRHSQEISTAQLESRKRAFNSFYETMIIFYKKHLAKKYPFFVNWLVYAGIHLKWMLAKRSMSV